MLPNEKKSNAEDMRRELADIAQRERQHIAELEHTARYHEGRAKACWNEAARLRAALV